MSEPRSFCRWCVSFVFTLGLTVFLLWLSYLPIRPRYFLVAFQVPPIANHTARDAPGGTVNFTLEVENKSKQMGVLHDPLAVSFFYGNRSGGSVTIPGFYQGHDKTADKVGEAGTGWVPWGVASREVAAKGTAVFRVGVVTGYRYKVLLWKGRRRRVSVGADVEVDGEGKKKARKGIRLRSSGAPLMTGAGWALAMAAVVLVVVVAPVVPSPLMLF